MELANKGLLNKIGLVWMHECTTSCCMDLSTHTPIVNSWMGAFHGPDFINARWGPLWGKIWGKGLVVKRPGVFGEILWLRHVLGVWVFSPSCIFCEKRTRRALHVNHKSAEKQSTGLNPHTQTNQTKMRSWPANRCGESGVSLLWIRGVQGLEFLAKVSPILVFFWRVVTERGGFGKGGIRICLSVHCLSAPQDRATVPSHKYNIPLLDKTKVRATIACQYIAASSYCHPGCHAKSRYPLFVTPCSNLPDNWHTPCFCKKSLVSVNLGCPGFGFPRATPRIHKSTKLNCFIDSQLSARLMHFQFLGNWIANTFRSSRIQSPLPGSHSFCPCWAIIARLELIQC